MPRSCLDCYYHSFVGRENWCCHPGIKRRIKRPNARCAEHIVYDEKNAQNQQKIKVAEMLKERMLPKEKTYKITHAGTAILCKICGMTSFNYDDVLMKYCGKCKAFHDS